MTAAAYVTSRRPPVSSGRPLYVPRGVSAAGLDKFQETIRKAEMAPFQRWVGLKTFGGEILGEIGRGRCSIVYQVKLSQKKLFAALKISLTEESNICFSQENEANHLALLGKEKCPYIVTLFQHGEVLGKKVTLLSYHKDTLKTALDKKIFNLREILNVGMQLYLFGEILMRKRVIHGDLNSDNVFLENGVLRVGDFGLSVEAAKLRGDSDLQTIPWRCPESFFLREKRSYELDHWSIAAILLELISRGDLFILYGENVPFEEIPFLKKLIEIIGPLPEKWKKSQFYRENEKELSSAKPGNLKEYLDEVISEEFDSPVEKFDPLLIALRDYLLEALSFGSRVTPARALSMPLFNDFYVYIEVIREADSDVIVYVEPSDITGKDHPLAVFRFEEGFRFHETIEKREGYTVFANQSYKKTLFTWTGPLSNGTRIVVKKDRFEMSSVFPKGREDRKDDSKGDKKGAS